MGFLAQAGGQIGQAWAGAAPAADSMRWGSLATGLDVSGDLLSGVGKYQQAQYAAKVQSEGAAATRLAGQEAESAAKGRTTRTVAEQRAAFAANGISLDSSVVENVTGATERVGALDAAMIHYNAAREAYGEEAQASLLKRAGRNALVGSALEAGSSFLGGASSLSDKWRAYQYSGAK